MLHPVQHPGLGGQTAFLFWTASKLPTIAASLGHRMLMVPCNDLCATVVTRTRRLPVVAKPFSTWLTTATRTCPHEPMLAAWIFAVGIVRSAGAQQQLLPAR